LSAWTDADLETPARVEIVQCRVGHEEERVAERLQAGLESVGRGDGIVVGDRPAPLAERAFADLPAEHESGLDHGGEDENRLRPLGEHLRNRLVRVEALQRRGGFAVERARGGREDGVHDRRSHDYRQRDERRHPYAN